MSSSGSSPVRLAIGSSSSVSSTASPPSYTLSPNMSELVMPRSVPGSAAALTGTLGDVTSVLWLRRDLRLHDHPALHEAAKDGPVVALFVLDPRLLKPAGAPRIAFLYQ